MAESHASKWEYHLEPIVDADALNGLGADGWELIAIDPHHGGYVFKRPLPSFRDRVTLEQKTRYYRLWERQREEKA